MKKTEDEILGRFEEDHAGGVTSIEIMAVLAQVGLKISEATLRKYVQLGLLPRSRRVGTRGKHQGSWDIYPHWTARHILEIKKLLAEGRTIREISEGYVAAFSKCMEAAAALREIGETLNRLGKRENADVRKIEEIREMITAAADMAQKAAHEVVGKADFIEIAI